MKRQAALLNSNLKWAVNALLCLGFISSSSVALAQKQTLTYDVYAGGINAVEAVMEMDLRSDRYDIEFSAYTRGFLGRIAPWRGTFESHGWVRAGDNGSKIKSLKPEQHKSTSTWRKEVEVKDYRYTESGGFIELSITEHEKLPHNKKIDPKLTKNTTDTLSAAMMVFQKVALGGECAGSEDVFDGKRRFKQVFTHKKREHLQASRYNVYEGEASVCTVEVQPMGGAWHKKPRGWLSIQEQGREQGMMPTVWIASIVEGQPAVPVKIFVKTEYGAMFMHLTEYHSGDVSLIADKRK